MQYSTVHDIKYSKWINYCKIQYCTVTFIVTIWWLVQLEYKFSDQITVLYWLYCIVPQKENKI